MPTMLLGLRIVAFEFCFLELKFPWKSSANNYFAMLLITIPLQVLPVPEQPPFTEYHRGRKRNHPAKAKEENLVKSEVKHS